MRCRLIGFYPRHGVRDVPGPYTRTIHRGGSVYIAEVSAYLPSRRHKSRDVLRRRDGD
jgi:hypothetical protein